ncbi:HAD hydrolase-like protein, partial [Bacillus sp. HC-Mk]
MKAIIFDFDGLIVDTETIWFHSFRDAVREYGGELPLEEFAKCIGTTASDGLIPNSSIAT